MNALPVRRAAGTLFVIVPLAFTLCFLLLQQLFEYPDILRQSTGEVLGKFAAGGTPLIAVWYVLTLSAVGFVPLTLLVHRVLAERDAPVLLGVATAIGAVLALGIAAGLAEPAGWELGDTINALSYLAWAVWLIAVGVTLLMRRVEPALAKHHAPRLVTEPVR